MTFNISYMNNPGMMVFPTNKKMWGDFIMALTTPRGGDVVATENILFPAGSLSAPGMAFSADADTGFYQLEVGTLSIGVNGSRHFELTSTGPGAIHTSKQVRAIAGTKTVPSYNFTSDNDTGVYLITAGQLGVSVADTLMLDISSTGLAVSGMVTSAGRTTAVTNYTNADSSTVLSTEEIVVVDTTTAVTAMVLPSIATIGDGRKYVICNSGVSGGANNVSVSANIADTIRGTGAVYGFAKGIGAQFIADLTNLDWVVISNG